jgi:hypothetical protein
MPYKSTLSSKATPFEHPKSHHTFTTPFRCRRPNRASPVVHNSHTNNTDTKLREMYVKDEGERSLAHKHPTLVAEWDYAKNAPLTPWHVTPGSSRMMSWICSNGHSWNAPPVTRTRGHGCRACQGRVATPERNLSVDRPDLLPTWDGPRNRVELGLEAHAVTARSSRKAFWTCPIHITHRYDARIVERANGRGCPFCSGKRVNASNSVSGQRPVLAAEWDSENERTADTVPTGSRYKAGWICRFDATHKWASEVAKRVLGTGCPF